MSKMFVHYNGTKADFIAAGKAAEYVNHIVFIKGGANGTGACVYTHGEYYGNVEEALAALKYFSKVKVGTTEAEAVGPNGTLTFAAADPSSVSLDVTNKGITIGLTDAFVNKVNAVGAKNDAAATGENATAFARIKNLEDVVSDLTGGSAASVSAQINNAINALDVEAVAGDYVASISQVDGKIAPVMGTFNFDTKGDAAKAEAAAKTYAETKATEAKDAAIADAANKYQLKGEYEAAGAAAEALDSAKKYADGLNTAMNTRVEALEAVDHAKLATDAAASAVATVLDGAPEKFDTLKEVAEWIADSESAATAADLVTRVGALEAIDHDAYKGADETVLTDAKTYAESLVMVDGVAKFDAAGSAAAAEAAAKSYTDGKDSAMNTRVAALETAKPELVAADEANAAAIATEKGRVDAIVADYLKAADKTELQGNIDAVSAVANAAATKAEVDAMWAWEELQ